MGFKLEIDRSMKYFQVFDRVLRNSWSKPTFMQEILPESVEHKSMFLPRSIPIEIKISPSNYIITKSIACYPFLL